MKNYTYVDQDGYHVVSEQEIMQSCWPAWKLQMEQVHGAGSELITAENCIEDWRAVHWADEIQS